MPIFIALMAVNCAPRIDDLRLDGLRPPQVSLIQGNSGAFPPVTVAAIVAELSTSRDLRLLAATRASGTYVTVVLCRGRTHIAREEARFDMVVAGSWREEPGTTGASQPGSERLGPIGRRYRYSVAIPVRQTGGAYSGGGLGERSFAELDLMRTPVDLCLVIDTSNYGPRWRSNTVVITAEAIRAAVAAVTGDRPAATREALP